jgi:hypothetical protein
MKHGKVTLVGKRNDAYYEKCRAALNFLRTADKDITTVEVPLFETQWHEYLKDIKQRLGGPFQNHLLSPLVYLNDDDYIGDAGQFLAWMDTHYGYNNNTHIVFFRRRCYDSLRKQTIHNPTRAYCYMDLEFGQELSSTVIFELFVDVAPLTCRNFIELCKGFVNSQGQLLTYRGTAFHRLVPHGFIQGGTLAKRMRDTDPSWSRSQGLHLRRGVS